MLYATVPLKPLTNLVNPDFPYDEVVDGCSGLAPRDSVASARESHLDIAAWYHLHVVVNVYK